MGSVREERKGLCSACSAEGSQQGEVSMALRIKLFIGLVRPQKIRPPHGSAAKDSTPPTPNPAESRSQTDRIKEFFMRRGAAEQHGKLFGKPGVAVELDAPIGESKTREGSSRAQPPDFGRLVADGDHSWSKQVFWLSPVSKVSRPRIAVPHLRFREGCSGTRKNRSPARTGRFLGQARGRLAKILRTEWPTDNRPFGHRYISMFRLR